jgi:hypothetical protein
MKSKRAVPTVGERVHITANHGPSECIHPRSRIAPVYATVEGYGDPDDGVPTLIVTLEDGKDTVTQIFLYQLERDESYYDKYRPFPEDRLYKTPAQRRKEAQKLAEQRLLASARGTL